MKRVDRAIIEKKKVVLCKKDVNYDDDLVYVKIDELEGEFIEFVMGCFEIAVIDMTDEIGRYENMIEEANKRLEELENSEWNEEEAIINEKEYIEYLKEEKRKLEEAEETDEIVIDYSMCKLNVRYNGKSIEVEDDKELLFKNMKIKIEKF